MKRHTQARLHQLVSELMSSKSSPMTFEQNEYWKNQLPDLKKDMIKVMQFVIFSAHSVKLIRRHLNQVQSECTLMLNVLHGNHHMNNEMEEIRLNTTLCLWDLIEYQQSHYSKYFDYHADMPTATYLELAKELERKVAPMVTAMCQYHADKRLQALVVGKMTSLLKNGKGSWHQVDYLQRLHRSIMGLCIGRKKNITSELRHLLLRANFNTFGFLAYCKDDIGRQMAENYVLRDQYNCLYNFQREFSTLSYLEKFNCFEPYQPKLKDLMLKYIKLELAILDRKNRPVLEAKLGSVEAEECRLPVTVTVDVLTYLFRLLLTTGVVMGAKTELFLFISRNFRTPGSGEGDISLKSVANKYQQVVNKTAITAKTILSKMLKQLNEEFT